MSRFVSLLGHLPIAVGVGTIAVRAALGHGHAPGDASLVELGFLFLVILACASTASAAADRVAERLGEPYGTLVLTLSAIVIEVAMVAAVMLSGQGEDTVARDTMFATLMIILNLLVGVALLVGGFRRGEQTFNLQSSSSYLGLIIAFATVALVLPRATDYEIGGFMTRRMEVLVALLTLAVYGTFLALQASSYRSFFAHERAGDHSVPAPAHLPHSGPVWPHAATLLAALVVVVLLAESLGGTMVGVLDAHGLPSAISGVLVACLILGPEGVAAVKAARSDSMQRTMNILLGSALSTIGLTVPAVLALSMIVGQRVELGLDSSEICLLAGTLLVCVLNLGQGRTNPMQGIVHLVFFVGYLVLIFDVHPGEVGGPVGPSTP
jgi:Ca2+:H+ antiporter